MRFKTYFRKALILIVLVATLAACSTTPTPTSTATAAPTVDQQPTLNALGTQVARTIVADLTQNAPTATPVTPTATEEPTQTPAPTNTPLPTVKPTATYIPWTATPLYTATPVENACSITEVTPKSTDTLAKKADFDGKWIVKNIGSRTWESESVDIVYKSGTKLQKKVDVEDLAADVPYNSSLTVIVDMTAPADAGEYSTTWAIVRGSVTICTLNLTVTVGN
jgi:hypothetical protein